MRLLSPRSCPCGPWCSPRCGGLAGTDENRNDEDTDGSDDMDSPDGLEGDGTELTGDPGSERRGEDGVLLFTSAVCRRAATCRGSCRIVSALPLVCGSSEGMPGTLIGSIALGNRTGDGWGCGMRGTEFRPEHATSAQLIHVSSNLI